MYIPSLTTVLSVAFLGYMANSMWNIIALYIPPSCPSGSRVNTRIMLHQHRIGHCAPLHLSEAMMAELIQLCLARASKRSA